MVDREPLSGQYRDSAASHRHSCQTAVHLPPYLFNLYTEHTPKSRLDSEEEVKIGGKNINNLRHADESLFPAASSRDSKGLLMKVKEESARAGLHLNVKTETVATEEAQLQPRQRRLKL